MVREEILIEKAKQVLKDFKRDFFEDTFKIFSPKDLKKIGQYEFSFDVWEVFVDVPDEQFGGQSPFSIYFKDENMKPFMFHDGGAPGRVPDLEIIKTNGKYTIGKEWVNT